MSSAAEDYAGGGEEQVFLLPHHNHQHAFDGGFFYHVPQHSRREKLRFPADDSLAATAPSLPLFYQANAASAAGLANLLPPSYYNVHDVDDSGAHHVGAGGGLHQIHRPGFSLSLSPSEASPLGPFTGYAAVLNRSGFVEPARQLLEEICQFGRGDFAGFRDPPPDALNLEADPDKLAGAEVQPWKKIKLASMLDEVHRKYRLCYQQVEAVMASFETVAGLNSAAPYVSIALKSMSRNLKSIKNAISGHLQHLDKNSFPGNEFGKREIHGSGRLAAADQACSQRRNNYGSITFGQPNAWRPQRGLPERAVAVLRAWLFEHFLHPYPTDTDKQILAKQTGLSRNQVSNWFINARVRLWKPMVEEIHNLELHQLKKPVAADDDDDGDDNNNNNNARNSKFQTLQPSSSSAAATSSSSHPPEGICLQRNYDNQLNRDYNNKPSSVELPHIEEPYNFVLNDFAGHDQAGLGGHSLVSLTLGLHQNNGAAVCLAEPMQMNVARRFGLEECGNSYILGAFEGQEMRQYGKEVGGHLLRDFVG